MEIISTYVVFAYGNMCKVYLTNNSCYFLDNLKGVITQITMDQFVKYTIAINDQ